MEVFKRKKELRKAIELVLKNVAATDVAVQSNAVFAKLRLMPEYNEAKQVSVYVSMPGELSTDSIIVDLLARGVATFVPQFKKGSKEMAMVRLSSLEDYRNLPEFMWGIRQPPFDEQRDNAMETGLDLMLLPGVAFTDSGHRLGHGGSYYDTYLHAYKGRHGSLPKLVALALKEQIVAEVPLTESDVDVDVVAHAD